MARTAQLEALKIWRLLLRDILIVVRPWMDGFNFSYSDRTSSFVWATMTRKPKLYRCPNDLRYVASDIGESLHFQPVPCSKKLETHTMLIHLLEKRIISIPVSITLMDDTSKLVSYVSIKVSYKKFLNQLVLKVDYCPAKDDKLLMDATIFFGYHISFEGVKDYLVVMDMQGIIDGDAGIEMRQAPNNEDNKPFASTICKIQFNM